MRKRTAAHFNTYSRELLPDLPRKSAEPVALTRVRPLQELLVTADSNDLSWPGERSRRYWTPTCACPSAGMRTGPGAKGRAFSMRPAPIEVVNH